MTITTNIIFSLFSLFCIGCSSDCEKPADKEIKSIQPPYLIDYNTLEKTRESFLNKEEPIYTFSKSLLEVAENWLDSSYATIVDKIHLPASGDKHDYYSIGPYWWPDSTKENGLPYIRKDGYRNPERLEYDRPQLSKMIEAVNSLALAYAISNKEKYKEKAIGYLNTWFINKKTKMNPNLEYGQAIPGITDGRGIGIIETRGLIEVVDAIGILFRKNDLKSNNYLTLQKWFEDYNLWLNNSSKGIDEKNWYNNHGTSYDLQVLSFSLFTGDISKALSIIDSLHIKRIIPQIEPDGSQPHELDRTKSLSYSIFNLELFIEIALIAEKLDRDLWNYESKDFRSISKAILFLIPFILNGEEWKYPELSDQEQLKTRFFKVINISNHKNKKLNFEKYFKLFNTNNYEIKREVLMRPQNIGF
jgi:hypothetical protein